MDAPSTSADVGPTKRQLPSRTRRPTAATVGGDVDLTILEATKVKGESQRDLTCRANVLTTRLPFLVIDFEGILEPTQRFLGTTNALVVKASVGRSHQVKTVQTEGYFNKPESIRSYREQSIIQTPEVIDLAEAPTASTRTRLKAGIEQVSERPVLVSGFRC